MGEGNKCSNCSKENLEEVNFCIYCGSELFDYCTKCWIKKEQPYTCGYKKCPGYKLFLEK